MQDPEAMFKEPKAKSQQKPRSNSICDKLADQIDLDNLFEERNAESQERAYNVDDAGHFDEDAPKKKKKIYKNGVEINTLGKPIQSIKFPTLFKDALIAERVHRVVEQQLNFGKDTCRAHLKAFNDYV